MQIMSRLNEIYGFNQKKNEPFEYEGVRTSEYIGKYNYRNSL